MNNENKYYFINKLPKEYKHILWDIMIKAESNTLVEKPEGLTKNECKLIMRFLYKNFEKNNQLQQALKDIKEYIEKESHTEFLGNDEYECPMYRTILYEYAINEILDIVNKAIGGDNDGM